MAKEKVKRIIYVTIFIFLLASNLFFLMQNYEVKQDCKELYEKRHLTEMDMKSKSTFITSSSTISGDEGDNPPEEVRYKKLYGVEYIGEYEIDKNGGINVVSTTGEPVKVLILDGKGDERFYAEVSELDFEPGEAGEYDVYLVGNKFTGRVAFSTYKCE